MTVKRIGQLTRIEPPKTKEARWRTSICLPERMLDELHNCLDREGISRKRRSQWIEQAIDQLLASEDYQDIVLEEFIEEGGNQTIPLTVRQSLKATLTQVTHGEQALIAISSVVRVAISQRIMFHGVRDERRTA
ncbi:MAG: hypothetical protein AAF542_21930 [Pseudomonadota bacterium]